MIHLCGKGNLDDTLTATDGYAQFEYANKELSDMFALADLVISRAGANAICELLALRKPNILIPLSAAASRGDQNCLFTVIFKMTERKRKVGISC